MTKKQSQLLEQVHISVQQTSKDVDWIKNGIRVNGSTGLEGILREQHEAIQDLRPKVWEVYEATTKIRSKFRFVRALREFVETRPLLKRTSEWVVSKALIRLFILAVWITLGLAGINLAGNTIKAVFEMLTK